MSDRIQEVFNTYLELEMIRHVLILHTYSLRIETLSQYLLP